MLPYRPVPELGASTSCTARRTSAAYPGETRAAARASFAATERAEASVITHRAAIVEQTPLINTLDEAARMVEEIGLRRGAC
jgi:hypothetical protein